MAMHNTGPGNSQFNRAGLDIFANQVVTGVGVLSRQALETIPYDIEAAETVAPAIEEFNGRTPTRYANPPEVEVPLSANPNRYIMDLAKAVTDDYGCDPVLVDSATSIQSNRSTERAINDIRKIKAAGLLHFVFFQETEETGTRRQRQAHLYDAIVQENVPILGVLVTEPEEISDAEIAQNMEDLVRELEESGHEII